MQRGVVGDGHINEEQFDPLALNRLRAYRLSECEHRFGRATETLEAALHGRQATSGLHENLEAGVEQQRPNLEQCLVNCNATVIFETERIAFFVQEQKAVLAPRFRAQASVEHSIVKIT